MRPWSGRGWNDGDQWNTNVELYGVGIYSKELRYVEEHVHKYVFSLSVCPYVCLQGLTDDWMVGGWFEVEVVEQELKTCNKLER